MSKKLTSLHPYERMMYSTVDCKKEELIAPDCFFAISGLLQALDQIRVFCNEPKGFSYRDYWVVSTKPLKVVPDGRWKQIFVPEEEAPKAKEGVQTHREIFVPMFCDQEDLNGYSQIRGEPVYTGDQIRLWEVRGESSGRIYATGIKSKEDAVEIMQGRVAYQTVPMGKAA